VHLARSQPYYIDSTVESIRRTGHGLHSQSKPVRSHRLVARMNLDPGPLASPRQFNAGPGRIENAHFGNTAGVPAYAAEGMVDLPAAKYFLSTEVEVMTFHRHFFRGQQPVRRDVQEPVSRDGEEPVIEWSASRDEGRLRTGRLPNPGWQP